MVKKFKEFSTGGFAMGSIDSVTPVVSLGPTDRPPESAKRRGDTRMIGLKDANQSPFKKKIINKLKKPVDDYLKSKEKKEYAAGMEGPGMGTYSPMSDLSADTKVNKKIKESVLYKHMVTNKIIKG